MKVLIVDDEPLARRGIQARLNSIADVEIVAACGNGREAIRAIGEYRPELVFLDVQMPGLDGFDVIHKVGLDNMPPVIFVTAYNQHAVQAFDVHALDYLLKPIDDDRFCKAMNRARNYIERSQTDVFKAQLKALLGAIDQPETNGHDQEVGQVDRFVVKTGGRIYFVRADEIDWIEAAGDYLILHVGSDTHLIRETMAAIEAKLDSKQFLRIHRSTILNMDRVKELQPYFNGEYIIILKDGTELKLSRSYRPALDRFLGQTL
jgi:two-component system LytT family response regulator